MNKYYDSNGKSYTESAIKARYSKFLRELYQDQPLQRCRGCNGQAVDTSHTIARARCKILHMVELIWDRRNVEPMCRDCHHKWENFKSGGYRTLLCVDRCLTIEQQYDKEHYELRIHY